MSQTRSTTTRKTERRDDNNGSDGVSPPADQCQGEYLNLDVLLLIATLAHPRDFLNLARTCKYFRVLLTDKSSDLVWRTVRNKFDGMPECPADLTEQEYTDIAFSARCHGCGGYTDSIFWEMRRRYCRDCWPTRLVCLSSCDDIIQKRYILPIEHLTINQETPMWVDRKQMESFLDDYARSPDKAQVLSDRQERLVPIRRHARQCEKWQRTTNSKFRIEQNALQKKREKSIFERLKQVGYQPEIDFFGHNEIRDSQKHTFNTSKQLTDNEWGRIWPKWVDKMNDFRLRRLEKTVFRSRREALAFEYATYVMEPAPNTPSFELLPHVADLARFSPFRDIIRVPEEPPLDGELFGSAFAQLPQLVAEWRKKLDLEVAELVEIPSGAPLETTSVASSTTIAPKDKLRLASAWFSGTDHRVSTHPEIFSISMLNHRYPDGEGDSERTGSIRERFGISYVTEASSVIRACGLDPRVATKKDMDRLNVRVKCLGCRSTIFDPGEKRYTWREAILHAAASTHFTKWELFENKTDSCGFQFDSSTRTNWERCLLCRPRVGDGMQHSGVISHLKNKHQIEDKDAKRGVHYKPVAASLIKPTYRTWGLGF